MIVQEFFEALFGASPLLLTGLWLSVRAGLMAILIGTLLGLILGLAMAYGGRGIRSVIRVYVDVVRGIPGLVKIFTVYYFINQLLNDFVGFSLSALTCGVIALSFHGSAQVAEMTRGAIQSLPKGQSEAGKAIGMTFLQIQLYIVYPQAIRQILPTWVTSATEVVKGTTLLSLISVPEFFISIKEAAAREYLFLEFYGFAMLVYFLLNFSIETFGARLERHYARY